MNTPRVALLTTDTPHHRYFAWQLAERHPLSTIVVETGAARAPFETCHPFEVERDAYERDSLLKGEAHELDEVAPVVRVKTINAADTEVQLDRVKPDMIVVFGTCRLGETLCGMARTACLNLHGGNPEDYRGLDSHLWAIYHRDFENLTTTLHHVDNRIDTGPIVTRCRLPIRRGMLLYELRAMNTIVCTQLTAGALKVVAEGGRLAATPQRRVGRYYSFMPAVLKADCVEKFSRYVATL